MTTATTTSTPSASTSSVTYSSTRGCTTQRSLPFRSVVMRGLAHDRGLFVPDAIPAVTPEEIESWRSLSYSDLAVEVIGKFVKDDEVPREKLVDIVKRSCDAFRSVDVTPVVEVGGHMILELFHGPTFAFKDVALQMLGNFFEYFLSTGSNSGRLTVLGATSGDTGSAAIYGLRGKKGVDCVILYPKGRVSEIQERQMATVQDGNIHCVAVEGTFDDCQDIVKASFNDVEFREKVKLGAVNSINWCRVLVQTTYYFWSYLRVTDKLKKEGVKGEKEVHFSVPTGNFGDVLAGYYAKRMGLPVGKLLVATNENDILHRFFTKGEYHRYDIQKTLSPSMDICVSSNFERYLYHLAGDDSDTLAGWMKEFESSGKLTISGTKLEEAKKDFLSGRVDTAMTLETIKQYASKHKYVLCPHSAVGVSAIHQAKMVNPHTVCLATAHEGKFPDAVKRAVGKDGECNLPDPPEELRKLWDMDMRVTECENDVGKVQELVVAKIEERVRNEGGGAGADTAKESESDSSGGQIKRAVVAAAVVAAVAVGLQVFMRTRRGS